MLKKFYQNKRLIYPILVFIFYIWFAIIVGLTTYFYFAFPTPHSFWLSEITPEQSADIFVLHILYWMIALGSFSLIMWLSFSFAYINHYLNQQINKKINCILVILYCAFPFLVFLVYFINKTYLVEWQYSNLKSNANAKIRIISLKEKLAFRIKWIFNKSVFWTKTAAMGSFAFIILGVYVITPGAIVYKIMDEVYVNKTTIENFYKLSRKKNVVLLYFDAAAGHIFNTLLKNNEKLSQNFSDFVSYENVVVNGHPTLFSFPTLMGGWDYIPNQFKKQNKTQEKFMNDSYFKFVKTLSKNGIENINMSNFQYYGKQTLTNKLFWYGNIEQFEKDMPSYVHGTSNAAINEYYTKHHAWDNLACLKLLKDMPKYLEVDETKGSTFIANFFLNTHVKLSYFDGNKYMHLPSDSISQIKATKQTLEMLTKILAKFKELGVYDNTMFIILSDHGSKYNGEYKDLSAQQLNTLDYNPVFAIKPFRNSALKNDSQRNKIKFDNKTFLALADLITILNNSLGNKANELVRPQYFQADEQNSAYLNNPLDLLENKNRIISSYTARDWRYQFDSNKLDIKDIFTFKGSIFNKK